MVVQKEKREGGLPAGTLNSASMCTVDRFIGKFLKLKVSLLKLKFNFSL